MAGIPFPGHTEMLAALTGTRRFAMMLAGGGLRVVLATRHLPLARVAKAVTADAIREAAELTVESLPWLGFPEGRIAICALNPHAGDGGLLGSEERTVIGPEIRALRRRGYPVDGPVPADVVFYQALQGRYAAVVALYHDQGLGPLKMLAFDSGINVTLGLPLVRTSPDHGTAFDVAWSGKASPGSMIEAVRLASRLARRPNPWAAGRSRA
jgi:4-hydroxythreonine-4-phosphate dehydrogenase